MNLVSILFAIIIFSVLIFVHELGHFLAAKASGVQVNEFAMFMGPALFKKQVGETLYSIRLIPIGGYCAMEGEDEDSDNPRSFQKAAWWKRLIILVAGSAMNLLLGLVIMIAVMMPVERIAEPVIKNFEEFATVDGPEGLQVGDRILKIDGENVYLHSDFSTILSLNPGDVHDLVVERNGQKVSLPDFKMEKHAVTDENGNEQMLFGISFQITEVDFAEKLQLGWYYTLNCVRNVRLSLQMLLTGQVGLQDMAGPVGIMHEMSDMAADSESLLDALVNMIYFGGFLAINLGVMNLLPIPALDGGRIVCLLITVAVEGITRKKIDSKYEAYLHAAGMILLLGFMAVVMFKDIFVIFKG